MIKMAGNFNDFILRKILSKVICFSVALIVIFNCILPSFIFEIDFSDFSKLSSIQKDVFSAVFLISSTIEKINFSLTSNLLEPSTSNKKDSPKKENKAAHASGDVIITGFQFQNNLIQYCINGINVTVYDKIRMPIALCNGFFTRYKTVYFIIMLLFFCSAKKVFGNGYKNLSMQYI